MGRDEGGHALASPCHTLSLAARGADAYPPEGAPWHAEGLDRSYQAGGPTAPAAPRYVLRVITARNRRSAAGLIP